MKQSTQPSEKITRSEPSPEVCHVGSIAEMVTESSIVAVGAGSDANYDCYPMKVTSNFIEKLEDSEKEDYGTSMAARWKIIRRDFSQGESSLHDIQNRPI